MKKLTINLIHLFIQYPFYFGILLITFFVNETYPFSVYPMYNNFPNWSYTFYMEDEHHNNLKKYMIVHHAELSHLYYTECDNQNIAHGYDLESAAALEAVGKRITDQAIHWKKLRESSVEEVRLYRIYNYIKGNKLISDTTILCTTYVK